jgi:hypothetical protein
MAGTSGLRSCGCILRPLASWFQIFSQPAEPNIFLTKRKKDGWVRSQVQDPLVHLVTLLLAVVAVLQVQRPVEEPFVGVGVWYAGPRALPPATALDDVEALKEDLALIRRAGFNAVTTWIAWRDAEPQPGSRSLNGLERLAAAAAAAELRVSVVVFTAPAPDWAKAKPGAATAFVDYLSKRMALQTAVLGVIPVDAPDQPVRGRINVSPGAAPVARLAMWAELARGGRFLAFAGTDDSLSPGILSLGETAGVVTRNQALFAPLRPRSTGVIGVSGAEASARVDVRLLESNDAIVIIGLNYAAAPQKVTIAFAPDIPEAIWQNLETGTAVSFVMRKSGPVLEHTFGPRDALVLMIRKTRR